MDAKLGKVKAVYGVMLRQCENGGMSPGQVAVYRRLLELMDTAADGDDWKQKCDAEDLFFKLRKELVADNWNAKAKAWEELGEPAIAESYRNIAAGVGNAANDEQMNGIITAEDEKAREIQKRESGLRDRFWGACYAIYEFWVLSPDDIPSRTKACETLRHEIKLIGGIEEFDRLTRHLFVRNSVPFKQETLGSMVQTARGMMTYNQPSALSKELKAEQDKIIAELKQVKNDMKQLQRDIDSRTKRAAFFAEAPAEGEGDYNFTRVWEEPMEQR